MMKGLFLVFILAAIPLNAQIYNGLNISKEQKLQLKNVCKEHTKVYDSIKLSYKKQIKKPKFRNSEEHYRLNQSYLKSTDSLESDIDNKIASILNENQRKIFWERVDLKKKKRAENIEYRF